MSDSSKMGLFGSKDKNQEQKNDCTKNETTGSYGPYCIDSDSETYDTETLSIMDINDIIGVQSEPVGDSTLESEIAALSEIITESKVEDNQALSGAKSDLQDDVLSIDQECFSLENVESMNSVSDLSEKVLEGTENDCNNENVMDSYVSEQLSMGNNESNNENVLESMLCDQVDNENSEVKDNCDPSVLKESLCVYDNENEKSDIEHQLVTIEDINVSNKTTAEAKKLIVEAVETSGVTELKETLSESNQTMQSSSKVHKNYSKTVDRNMENISEVSSSLQLIEEAYTSEDSQDTNLVEPMTKEANEFSNGSEPTAEVQDASDTVEVQDGSDTAETQDASDTTEMPEDVISSEICQKEDDTITISESKLEDDTIAMSENKLEDDTIAMSENKLEDDTIAMSENKLEDDTIAMSENKLEDDTIAMSGNTLEDDTIAMSENKLEDDTIAISESKLKDDTIAMLESKLEDDTIAMSESKSEVTEMDNCTDNEDKETEESSLISEAKRDMVLNTPETTEDNDVENKDNVLMPSEEQTLGEDISTSTTNTEEVKEESSEEMEVSEAATPGQSTPMDEPMEVDKLGAETCTEEYVELEPNTIEENTLENFGEVEAADEEHISERVATDEPELQSVLETNPNTINDTECENNTSEITVECEPKEKESVDATDDCNIPQNIAVLECLQAQEEMNIDKLDAEELQDESLKLINQLTTETNAHLQSEEQPMEAGNPDIELSMKMEHSVDETLNTIDNIVAEIDTNINAEANQNLNVTESQIDSKEFSSEDSAEEMAVEQPTPLDQPIECSPVNSEESDIKKVDLVEEYMIDGKEDVEESSSNTTENTSEGTEVLEKIDNEMVTQVEASCDILIPKPGECVPEKVLEETNEVIEDIEEQEEEEGISDIQKDSDTLIISEPCKEETNSDNEMCEDTNPEIMDIKEDEEEEIREEIGQSSPATISMDNEEPNKELSLEQTVFSSMLENSEDASDIPNESNIAEIDIVAESDDNAKSAEQVDTKIVEVKNDDTQNQISDLPFLRKRTVSPHTDHADLVVPEEDAVEERIEEEMNLTLDPEESDVQDEDQSSQSDILGKDDEKECSNSNTIEPMLEEDESMQIDIIRSIKENNTELENIEESPDIEKDMPGSPTSLNPEISMLSKSPEESESNSQTDIESNNLRSILETANNVDEMFSEEQCQNTQDIVKSILDDVGNVTDFKNILEREGSVDNEIENVLQQSADLPLVESEMEDLTEKLPENSQNMDSLEGLLGLDLLPEGEDSASKTKKLEEEIQEQETLEKEVDMALLLEQSNRTSDIAQASDYITDVIGSCLTNTNNVPLQDSTNKADIVESINDKPTDAETSEVLKADEDIISESINSQSNIVDLPKDLEVDNGLPENDLDMDFEENPLESVADLEETESKLELASDMLLQNVDQGEHLNDASAGVETSQASSEISELESAVKFLQESEEQAMDSPLVLSPKLVESVVDDISKQASASSLFVTDEDICEDTSELEAELQDIATDSISISEAEIISEAAKLETERKLAQQAKITASTIPDFEADDIKLNIDEVQCIVATEIVKKPDEDNLEKMEVQQSANVASKNTPNIIASLPQNVLKISESIPKISILEERLKIPPKIEIPSADVSKVCISPTTSKDSLLIQRDAKMMAYQRMLESPKLSDRSEPKIMDTPRKDSEKHDFENVGSPRIILKIAKSAIADCGEPRSPKSPKIRSAANSPNPEDSPGQKLGKIKLKLSKGGHPSIISNENVEETGQWYSDCGSSLSPIGMKIKLSKSGDASIVSSDKHESTDDCKETKHKFEEAKRTESPIGMKIKLSKSGDASIVQQDSKETMVKHKEKLEIMQGSPKRTESPIGMKIKLSKTGDASIIQSDRQDFPDEHKENTLRTKDMCYDSPKRTDSPIGMKIKLSKTGDASIISPDISEDGRETNVKFKEKMEACPETPKRTDSPIGMKIKLSKTKGGASIISMENNDEPKEKLDIPDIPKRTESPLGMKIKLSKTGDASIIHSEVFDDSRDQKQREKVDSNKDKSETVAETSKSSGNSPGLKIKVTKSSEASLIAQETAEESSVSQESSQKVESSIGMKIKLSKSGDASIVPTEQPEQVEEYKNSLQDTPKRTESPIGMKIKLSKSGDASIIQTETSDDANKQIRAAELEQPKSADSSLGMKIKLLKTGDASIVETDKKDRQQKRRETESPLEMKIKLSKTGHATIVTCDSHAEPNYKPKDVSDPSHNFSHRYKEPTLHKEPALKILKTGHSTILQSNRAELTIEPIQVQSKKVENTMEISPKRKEITISPIEPKKSKLETQLSQILPEVTIQPVMSRDQKQLLFDPKTNLISRQQMNVISQEISITQVRPSKPTDTAMSEKLKDILTKNVPSSPMSSDCEIIEHRPELIIVNENSNSSQDVMIIEEVSSGRMPEVKVPKKRGRPRRNPMAKPVIQKPPPLILPKDPLTLDEPVPQPVSVEHRENERPKRTCRNQKSYAPPKRGRGRGRGKRKLDNLDGHLAKKPRIEQDLSAIEASTMSVITVDEPSVQQESLAKSSELYKALKQPPMDAKNVNTTILVNQFVEETKNNTPNSISSDPKMQISATGESSKIMPKPLLDGKDKKASPEASGEKTTKTMLKPGADEKTSDKDSKDMLVPPGHPNWLTPTSKRQAETSRHENVSTVQVIDEETRMSAESGSRSQTPARNISAPASENIVNEESQGSVLSTATTESEKVKVKNRRMEINFDPDEGPFTVDKIAEYEWPLDRKGETFMIQEQISQYLGVKSFKRKYPDLKRRMVDMEERNYLRENGLVSEAMCDMGLTAVCSSEVLDVMCSDFPDQYEEYRKHMREKQVKEHSKKQKELTAAANAEKNRIDLAEMAVQSALSWNVSLNKARKESRKCSLDLQTFTIHVPKKQQKVETERKISHYPVALIPGQYTDYYREYTAAELRYYPLNTVLYGPMRPNERKLDSQSEGSQSDSDSDSSSDDSSSSSSEGTQDTEGSQSTMDDVDMEIVNQKDEIKLKCKMCLKTLNKLNKNEILIQCGTCNGHVHPSCIDLTLDMVPHIQSYAWQCTDCKTCAQCHDPADEDKMLFCDMCDRGYHIYCVGLRRVPQGRWHCQECAVCANCGSREPGGMNSDRNSVAQWQHEYKKGEKNTRVYVSTLCVPCSKLWRKGRYCPHCSRCHTAPRLDLEPNLVHCSACDKYLHLGCVEIKGAGFDKKNYLCDFCTPNRQHVVKPLVSKVFKT